MSGAGAGAIIGAAATLVSAGIGAYSSAKTAKASTPKPVAAPIITPPATMPDVDDAAVRAAKRREIMARSQSSGRQSTILTDRETLG